MKKKTERAQDGGHKQLPFALELLLGLSDFVFLVGMAVNLQQRSQL
jgi:hypothetical protein